LTNTALWAEAFSSAGRISRRLIISSRATTASSSDDGQAGRYENEKIRTQTFKPQTTDMNECPKEKEKKGLELEQGNTFTG
jgi:hypothetical protein